MIKSAWAKINYLVHQLYLVWKHGTEGFLLRGTSPDKLFFAESSSSTKGVVVTEELFTLLHARANVENQAREQEGEYSQISRTHACWNNCTHIHSHQLFYYKEQPSQEWEKCAEFIHWKFLCEPHRHSTVTSWNKKMYVYVHFQDLLENSKQ